MLQKAAGRVAPKVITLTFNSAQAEFYLHQANGKLYFECLKIFSVPENHLPHLPAKAWGKPRSEVGGFCKGYSIDRLPEAIIY